MKTSGFGRSWVGLTISAAVLSLCLGTTALAELLGDRGQLDPLLKVLVKPLGKHGIDVVAGDTSEVKMPKSSRPRVARLSGMPTVDRGPEWRKATWMKEFEKGAAGFVAGVKSSDEPGARSKASRSRDGFLAKWNEASPDRRVFVSFTSKDAAHAHATARALEDAGYVTFVFLRQGDQGPAFEPTFVGKMFAEAGHHMVIDTQNARKSEGVWFEASLAQAIRPSGGDDPGSPRGGGFKNGRGPGDPGSPRTGGGIDTSPEMAEFNRGLKGWIVTENPSTPGKLFVHRSASGGTLDDLAYLIKVEKDGSWTVHRAGRGGSGATFGERIGKTEAPKSVRVGQCDCR